jgi:hypothetical protein
MNALNDMRHIKFNMKEYEEKYNDKEIFITITFDINITNEFTEIV